MLTQATKKLIQKQVYFKQNMRQIMQSIIHATDFSAMLNEKVTFITHGL